MVQFTVTLFLIGAVIGVGSPARAASRTFTSEADPQNFAHASFLGAGFYSVGGRQIYIIRLDLNFTLRSEDDHPWGLYLTFRPTFGFYDFKPRDVSDFDFPDSVGTLSVPPGIEFRLPVLDNWLLKPFVEAGPVWEFDSDTVTWIYGLGVESRAEFPAHESRFLLWNTLLWAGNWESDISSADDFVVFETTIEWRRLMGWTPGGHPTELGPLLRAEFYLDALGISPPEGEPIEIDHRYEVGLTWGLTERVLKWRMPIPRVGLTYRFGEGDSGYRLLFTTRF